MKKILFVISILLFSFIHKSNAQGDQLLGEIKLFAGNFAPLGWMKCEGQILNIAQNTALFSILGTTYGGNGTTNFALPDLRGRIPIALGQGPGLSSYSLGQQAGVSANTMSVSTMPAHTHQVAVSSNAGNSSTPVGNYPAHSGATDKEYTNTSNSTAASNAVGTVGSGTSFTNMQPTLGLTFIIAVQGIFPNYGN